MPVRPAPRVRTVVRRTFFPLFHRALDVFPAWDERLDAPDSFDGYLMLINGGTDASNPFNVRFREEALMALGLRGQDQSLPFVQSNGFNGYPQLLCNRPYRICLLLFVFYHTCIYKYKFDAIARVLVFVRYSRIPFFLFL